MGTIKKAKYTYRGLNQDVTKSKHPFQFYYNANNIRIITTDNQTTASLQNEKGNTLIITMPEVCVNTVSKTIEYDGKVLNFQNDELIDQVNSIDPGTDPVKCSGQQTIIGYGLTREDIILFTTDDNGFDCVWRVHEIFDSNYDLELLYLRDLNFSTENPIQSIFNFESSIIQKIYWVDGRNQMRFLNLEHSIENGDLENLIDINSTNVNVSGEYSLSQPQILQVTNGGNHTSGMIQYAFNLYKLNGSQTTISPLSELTSLDFGLSLGGGELNEVVGSSPLVEITDIDKRYTHLRLYAIKYTSYNEEPEISLIVDREIDNYNQFRYFDDGGVINTISLSEFLFLGSNVFIPRHIATKDNRMFAANITDKSFDFEIDTRAYSHTSSGQCSIWNNVSVNPGTNTPVGTTTIVDTSTYNVVDNHDAINPNYDLYQFQSDGTTYGGEGKFIKYEILQKTESQLEGNLKYLQFFKDNELYRIGIQFYNSLGQTSFPSWIADFRTPSGNLEGNYNTLKVEIKLADLNAYIATLGLSQEETPIGYKIIRADRTANDKTVICQGSLSGMMCQTTKDVRNFNFWKQELNRREESDKVPKLPIIFSRGRQFEGVVSPLDHLYHMNENPSIGDDDQEIFRESDTDFKRQQTWQYNKMYQMYSPDILFNTGVTFNSNMQIRILGLAKKVRTNLWHKRVDTRNLNSSDGKRENFTGFSRGDTVLNMYGLFGPSRDDEDDATIHMNFKQYYHECSEYVPANNVLSYNIYGTPEITERGQGNTSYNNDSKFRYTNSLEAFLTDRKKWTGRSKKNEAAITGINTFGAKCVTLVQGEPDVDIETRKSLEELWASSGITDTLGLLIGEITYPSYYLYVGNIYGGNTFESKSRNSYLEIGDYQDLTDPIIEIESPGDTFVQLFKIARLSKTDIEVIRSDKMQLTEILEFPVETAVNLRNRRDLSLQDWDAKLQPRYEEFHEYNRVYSQQPNLVQNQSESFKFKKTNSFDTQIISSKLKIPGETIDNWTDFLENEVMNLDGKYGGINSLVNFKDNIYALQDSGVAHISINPRVQVQGSDGVDIELGRGSVLYDYSYISTTSGTINKWSVFNTPSGFYYLDAFNKSWNRFTGGQIVGLTDAYGLHAYFENFIDHTDLKVDNPILKSGASGGFDFINNNAYLTVHQKEKSFTINFNEGSNSFESFHDYLPSIYINKGHKMYTTSPDVNKLYEHDEGEYQTFYETKYPSTITFQVNPEADMDCVFNNIEFKSELYINDLDIPSETITHISAWNEYQNSGRIPLVLNNNIKRKFREWRAQIPRQQGSRDRIRNPWIYLKLELDTRDNLRLVLHDVIINYTV